MYDWINLWILLAMATASAENMAQPVLKKGHDLRGRDMLPVVGRITSLPLEEWTKRPVLASFSTKHALESYSGEELAAEFKRMTNYDIMVCSFLVYGFSIIEGCIVTDLQVR